LITNIFNERWWLFADTVITDVDRVTASIYSADPRVDRHHLISISSYHSMKIHTLSFATFGLSHYVWDFVDSHGLVGSYHFIFFLRASSLM
jgi:hypothetical protein